MIAVQRVQRFLAIRAGMHGGKLDDIAALNLGSESEAVLLASDLEALLKLAMLAQFAAQTVAWQMEEDVKPGNTKLSDFLRQYQNLTGSAEIRITSTPEAVSIDEKGE